MDLASKRIQSAAQFTRGVSGHSCEVDDDWLGQRLAFWPQGVTGGRTIGLVSSRLGTAPESRGTWFALLRTICAKVESDDVLVHVAGTTTDRFVQRSGELFNLPILRVHLPEPKATMDQWLQSLPSSNDELDRAAEVYLSPLLEPSNTNSDIPLRDRAVIAVSDRVFALHVRSAGNLHELITRRLEDPRFPIATVFVAIGSELVDSKLADQLLHKGAIGLHLFGHDKTAPESSDEQPQIVAPQIPIPTADDWQYLTHCTRRRVGMWPDQTETDYLDDLILSRPAADHSPLSALTRIVERRKLIASNEAIRGGTPVVSFTEVPLAELPELRTFRPHRARWDFEPYGVCIRRDWLEAIHAGPVEYGDEERWDELPEERRPFFQLSSSTTRAGQTIDWSAEREWRIVGDVDLSELPSDAAFVFVKSQEDADQVAARSPWPVAVMT